MTAGVANIRATSYFRAERENVAMQSENKMFDDFVKMVNGFAGTMAGMGREAEASMREKMREFVAGADFVGRDEFEAVKAMASAARDENEILRARIAALEADLRRVKRDAEVFGRDLRQLRSQKEQLEAERKEEAAKAARAQKQSQTQIRLLKDEAKEEREKNRVLQDELRSYVCPA